MTTLNDISAADFLQLVENGDVDLSDYLEPVPQEKVASSLSELSDEELLGILENLESDDLEKEAGDFDLNELSVGEFMEYAALVEEQLDMDKEASAFDLNELSVEEFLHFAANLEDEMEKEAMMNRAKGVATKYIPGVKQFRKGSARKKAADMIEEATGKPEAGNPGAQMLERLQKKKRYQGKSQADIAASERSYGTKEQLIGGAKTVATGAGIVAGATGIGKAIN